MRIIKLLLPLLIATHLYLSPNAYSTWRLYGDGKLFYESVIDLINKENSMSQEVFRMTLKHIMCCHDSNVDESKFDYFLLYKNGDYQAFNSFKNIFFFGTDNLESDPTKLYDSLCNFLYPNKNVIELTENAIKDAKWWKRSTERLDLILEELKKRDVLWDEYIQQRAAGKYPRPQFRNAFTKKAPPIIPPSNIEIAQKIFYTAGETLIGKPMDFVSRITGISYGVNSYCAVNRDSVFGFGVDFCRNNRLIVKRSLAALTTVALSYAAYKLYKKYTKKEEPENDNPDQEEDKLSNKSDS